MIPLGLNASDRRALHEALVSTNRIQIHVSLMTLGQEDIGSLTDYLIDGQIEVDGTQIISRQLSMSLLDPKGRIPFDTDSSAASALFMDRMVQVNYRVLVNGSMIPIPVFTGPVTGLKRSGSNVEVICQSKERLALGNVWPPLTIAKNMKKIDAVTKILKEAGEDDRHLVFPDLPARLPHAVSMHRSNKYWPKAHDIIHSMDRQLYYDGEGFCRIRHHPGFVWTFNNKQHIVGDVDITYGGETANTVMIVGAKPKGHKHPIVAIAVAPARHPLSPIRLGRNGQPRHILLTGQPISMPHVKHHAEAMDIAERKLNDALRQQVDVQFSCLPGAVALLDHGDLCHVHNDQVHVPFRLDRFTLPLKDGNTASVGFNKNASIRKRNRHHHHPHRHKSRKHR